MRSALPASLVAAAALALPAGAAAATPATPATWARPQQQAVVRAGLLAPLSDGDFHGERPLSARALRGALGALAVAQGTPAVAVVDRVASLTDFDRLLVAQLGLADAADALQREARRAGLAPRPTFGDEVVARLLELRTNHPFEEDALERFPWEPVLRSDAAWSLERARHFDGRQQDWVRGVVDRFALPAYTDAQRRALRIAVARVGMPYVWGGETDAAGSALGGQVHGGYDCSGLVWRVFKLGGLPAGAAIRGRTAAQQAGEVPASTRVRLAAVRPADLLFFGPGRFDQRATEGRIVHEGIALSDEFMVHSSSQGVTVVPLFEASRRASFSWARRVVG